ncbi:MAG: hypothetical protein AAF447_11100 [Myxococcota bacterium]
MNRSLRRRAEAGLFNGVLRTVAALARSPVRSLVAPFLAAVAPVVRAYRGVRPAPLDAKSLGERWQDLMPSKKGVPITGVEGDTAYGEIRMPCPLRGTGDVHACHRLMAYDRALMRPDGARFVVLESQAEAGVERCRIAIRPAHLDAQDLVDAHVRVEALTAGR